MKLLLFALLAAQPASQPSSRPARLAQGGTGQDVNASVTLVVEVSEELLKNSETWTLTNNSGKLVAGKHLQFKFPDGAHQGRLDEDVKGFAINPDLASFKATQSLGAGTHSVSGAFFIEFQGSSAVITRTVPVNTAANLIVENIPGLEIGSNVKFDQRLSNLNGLQFQVLQFQQVPAGGVLEIRLDSLPSRNLWPRRLALALSLAMVLWMLRALMSRDEDAHAEMVSPVSAQARRDQILKAIEVLERDFRDEKIKEKRYERRREELMQELAAVLRELELSRPKRG